MQGFTIKQKKNSSSAPRSEGKPTPLTLYYLSNAIILPGNGNLCATPVAAPYLSILLEAVVADSEHTSCKGQ